MDQRQVQLATLTGHNAEAKRWWLELYIMCQRWTWPGIEHNTKHSNLPLALYRLTRACCAGVASRCQDDCCLEGASVLGLASDIVLAVGAEEAAKAGGLAIADDSLDDGPAEAAEEAEGAAASAEE